MVKTEKITGDYLVQLFSSDELIDVFNEHIKRVERNNAYAFDLIRYFGSEMDYRSSQYGAWKYSYGEKNVKINRRRKPLDDSHHSYTPEGFYFLSSGHFESIYSSSIHVSIGLPSRLKKSNKELRFNSKPIGIVGTVYDAKNVCLFLWQCISDDNISESEINDEVGVLSLAKMLENPDNFFENYNIPLELRKLPTINEAVNIFGKEKIISGFRKLGVEIDFSNLAKDRMLFTKKGDFLSKENELQIEQLAAWKLCIPYVFLKAFGPERGCNSSILRFENGKFNPKDLKTLESFAFDVHPIELK